MLGVLGALETFRKPNWENTKTRKVKLKIKKKLSRISEQIHGPRLGKKTDILQKKAFDNWAHQGAPGPPSAVPGCFYGLAATLGGIRGLGRYWGDPGDLLRHPHGRPDDMGGSKGASPKSLLGRC